MSNSVYLYALLGNLCFSASTLIFTEFTNKTSIPWVNKYKVLVTVILSAIVISAFYGWSEIAGSSIMYFIISGLLGLCIGDYFMLRAFTDIGPGRTLMLYGFTPIIAGIGSYFLFDQSIEPKKFLAIIFMMGCLFTFSYEKFKEKGRWEFNGFLMALIFVVLDAFALLLTRYAYDASAHIAPLEGHFYRCLGALSGFWILMMFKPINFVAIFKKMTVKQQVIITIGSIFGTFLSLWFYFTAIKVGHIATVTSISITSPFFASIFECIYYKKKPSIFLILAFIQFLIGFTIVTSS